MKNKCEKIRDLFLLYFNGLISDENKDLINKHLNECSECLKKFQDWKNIWFKLDNLDVEEPSEWLKGKIISRLSQEKEKSFFEWKKILIIVNFAIFLIIAGWFIGSNTIQNYNSYKNHEKTQFEKELDTIYVKYSVNNNYNSESDDIDNWFYIR